MDAHLNLSNDNDELYTDNFIHNLFQKTSADDRFIEAYETIHVPKEPIQSNREFYSITVPRRNTNTWTQLSSMILNVGIKFEKYHEGNWYAVTKSDKTVPVSNLVRCLFEDIEIRLNQTRITSANEINPQIVAILDMLTLTKNSDDTVGELGGVMLDTMDPDKDEGSDNFGAYQRQNKYCIDGTANKLASVTHLQAGLTTSISGQDVPYPSGLDFHINLKRAKDKNIITHFGDETNVKYRIDIAYLELICKHYIINPALQLEVEKIWSNKKELGYTYNRLDVSRHTLPGGSYSFLSPNLFEGNQIPPVFFGNLISISVYIVLSFVFFLVFFQSQKRTLGDFSLSTHHFELPGKYLAFDNARNLGILTLSTSLVPA